MKRFIPTLLFAFLAVASYAAEDLTHWVNPFIGTGFHGHCYPGAVVPYGMVQPGPDTRRLTWDACSGYHYDDEVINGFSHTHLSGTGCCELGDLLLMPIVGKPSWGYMDKDEWHMAYASRFSHHDEVAMPGYYSVQLLRYGIRAEVTTTERVAMHRYTFPESEDAAIILDWDYSLERQRNRDMTLKQLSDTEIVGSKRTFGWVIGQPAHFYIRFSKPFTMELMQDTLTDGGKPRPCLKAVLHFKTKAGEQILAEASVSETDIEGARNNVLSAHLEFDFDRVRREAKEKWNTQLGKIQMKSRDPKILRTFYTALYHASLFPMLCSDADGRYFGMDEKIHQTDAWHPMYTGFSLWDTYRAFHPLLNLIDGRQNERFVHSLVEKAKQFGCFPNWELYGIDTGCMIGYHGVSVVADAWQKGFRDFDVEEAWRLAGVSAGYNPQSLQCHPAIIRCVFPKSKLYKDSLGYALGDNENESVSKMMEYCYDDWCIASWGKAMGKKVDFSKARAYKNHYDKSVGYVRGRLADGTWRTPFDPRAYQDFCEGNSLQYSFNMQHDVKGMIQMMGGRKKTLAKLDDLLTMSSDLTGTNLPPDVTGLIGQYAHGNEPSHHILYLYDFLGQPRKTQEYVDHVLQNLYTDQPDGLCGNEDCGQMSAWYLFSAMGFYPFCPGSNQYTLGRPIVDEASFTLSNGQTVRVVCKNQSRQNKHVRQVTWNGKKLKRPFITYEQLQTGGVLEFEMEK